MFWIQAGVLTPADNVLNRHMFQSLSQGIIETRSRSRRNSTEKLLRRGKGHHCIALLNP